MRRVFMPGEVPTVVLRADRAHRIRYLQRGDGCLEILDITEVSEHEMRRPDPVPAEFLIRTPGAQKPPNAAHGPERKGAGGKVRRW